MSDVNKDADKEDELHVHHHIKVDGKQEPMRIDKFLLSKLEKISRNRIQKGIQRDAVLVNDKPVKSNYKIRPHDDIKILLSGEPSGPHEVLPEEIPIDIVYEDEAILIINKQHSLVVHPGVGNFTGTLVNGLAHHFQEHVLPLLPNNSPDRPGLVHRLDKDTTGLMVIAKTEQAMTHLAKQFFDHSIERSYQALLWGGWDESEGTIDANIGRHPTDRLQQYVFKEGDGDQGKRAVTHYKVLKDYYYVSLVECRLETGRTHQIRVHMASLGHPVFSDSRYGGDRIRKGTIYSKYKQFVQNCFDICPRQALHAKSLGFIHPVSGEKVYFENELPDDIQGLLNKWEAYFNTRPKDH